MAKEGVAWRVRRAAEQLKIKPNTLRSRMKKLEIDYGRKK